jgi:Phage integrase family
MAAGVVRGHRPRRLPVVLTEKEVRIVLGNLQGTPSLVAQILYGSGLRLMEALCLRIKDVDFEKNSIVVRVGKGDKDRITMLPESLKVSLQAHLTNVFALHQKDLSDGWGRVELPGTESDAVQQCKQQASTSPPSVTHCAILSGSATLAFGQVRLLTCSNTATIFARFKNYWDIGI